MNPVQRTVFDRLINGWNMDLSPGYHGFMALMRVFSPYELNPVNINPLRDILEEMIDFDSLSRCVAIKLFISATNVHTGKISALESEGERYEKKAVTIAKVMASFDNGLMSCSTSSMDCHGRLPGIPSRRPAASFGTAALARRPWKG